MVLQEQLSIPEATVYRAIKTLKRLKLIEMCFTIRKSRRRRGNKLGGPRPHLYVVNGSVDVKCVANAIRLHHGYVDPVEDIRLKVQGRVIDMVANSWLTEQELSEFGERD